MEASSDRLQTIFSLQETLNDRIFAKKEIRDHQGNLLNMAYLREQANSGQGLGPNSETNEWLGKYLEALNDEGRELKEELLWKWWSKDNLNLQNIRVEIIDQFHFWISLALTAGLDAEKVYQIYMQKNQVNHDRQSQDYSKKNKNEEDNRPII